MNTRIRYHKAVEGKMISRRNFLTSEGREVKVELDLNSRKYRVVDAASGSEVASGGDTVNVNVLKIQAKQHLTTLGVEFADESRVREVDDGHEILIGS